MLRGGAMQSNIKVRGHEQLNKYYLESSHPQPTEAMALAMAVSLAAHQARLCQSCLAACSTGF
jgi:hypothetical protein